MEPELLKKGKGEKEAIIESSKGCDNDAHDPGWSFHTQSWYLL
jgi:hypothetical protein